MDRGTTHFLKISITTNLFLYLKLSIANKLNLIYNNICKEQVVKII